MHIYHVNYVLDINNAYSYTYIKIKHANTTLYYKSMNLKDWDIVKYFTIILLYLWTLNFFTKKRY